MSEDLTQKLPTSPDPALAQILSAVHDLSGRMEHLEKKVDERLFDTRPIWEKVLVDIAQLQEGQQRLEVGQQRLEARQQGLEARQRGLEAGQQGLEAGQQGLEAGQQGLEAGQQGLEAGHRRIEEKLEALRDETRTGMRNLKRQFLILNDTFLEVRADYKDLDKRLYQLEEPEP
jgi:chromosome segregation ATPase